MKIAFVRRRPTLYAGALALAVLVAIAGVLVARGLGPGVALAADGTDASTGSISVNGQATIKAAPDTATITFGVQAQASNAADAMAQCTSAMNRVIATIISSGVPRANIQTTNVNLYPQYEYQERGPGRIVGYQASNQVSCTWTQLDKIGDLIDDAVQAGANNVYGITFSVADSKALYLEAIAEAVRDARAKAEALAAAAGCRVGSVKNMSLESYVPGPVVLERGMAAAAGSSVPVEPGMVEMVVYVRVEYGIQ